MTKKVDRIILINFVISRNYSKLCSSISRISFKYIERNISLFKNLLIVRISTITDLDFIV